jgi:hypothetical protein
MSVESLAKACVKVIEGEAGVENAKEVTKELEEAS